MVRRLLNCDQFTTWQDEANNIINHMQKMLNFGYDDEVMERVVERGMRRYDGMVEEVRRKGHESLCRMKEEKMMWRKEEVIPNTTGGKLAKKVRKLMAGVQVARKMRLVETGGQRPRRDLRRSDPSATGRSERARECPCTH